MTIPLGGVYTQRLRSGILRSWRALTNSSCIHRLWLGCERGRAISRGSFTLRMIPAPTPRCTRNSEAPRCANFVVTEFSEVSPIRCSGILSDEAVYRRIQHRSYPACMFGAIRWRTTISIPLLSGIATTGIGAGGECRRPGLSHALFALVRGREILRSSQGVGDSLGSWLSRKFIENSLALARVLVGWVSAF
jgi:hypothetical protein